MTKPPAIIDFDFETEAADSDLLIQAWMPEIEQAILRHEDDDRFIAFLVAALRLGARSKTLSGFNLMEVIEKAGYSRSTFFRLFEGYTGFLLKGYQLSSRLTINVYAKHLHDQTLDLDGFCKFTADVFYGVYCTIPTEIMQVLWREHNLSHQEFHPHLPELAAIFIEYLSQNEPTKHLSINLEEMTGVTQSLDLIMLTARLKDDPQWGQPEFYVRLRKLFKGYLLAST